MEIKQMYLEVTQKKDSLYHLHITDQKNQVPITFDVESKELVFLANNPLSQFLSANEYQFRKLLHNKRPHSYYVGFRLKFSIIDGKDVAAFNNKDNIVVKDHGEIKVIPESEKEPLVEIYTDGSYDEIRDQGAYCLLKKDESGEYEVHQFIGSEKDSCAVELQAVIKALKLYPGDLRIMTDSQYVRKGITEWMVHWKLNGWRTANGTKAKNSDLWLELESLCKDRRIEFGYVPSHSEQFENEYCDLLARAKRESARRNRKMK